MAELTQLLPNNFESTVIKTEGRQDVSNYFIPRLMMLFQQTGLYFATPDEITSELFGLFAGMTMAQHVIDEVGLKGAYINAETHTAYSTLELFLIRQQKDGEIDVQLFQFAVEGMPIFRNWNSRLFDRVAFKIISDFPTLDLPAIEAAVEQAKCVHMRIDDTLTEANSLTGIFITEL